MCVKKKVVGMRRRRYSYSVIALSLLVLMLVMTGCGNNATDVTGQGKVNAEDQVSALEPGLKYIFLFIGDGMSYPQIQAASDYLGALADPDYQQALPSVKINKKKGAVLDGPIALNFMEFEEVGSATNYDASSFAPDSSSSATSIATGHKTHSGMLNMMVGSSEEFETIAEKLHEQRGWKVGIVSSVNVNHATPAAFYAHQSSRDLYYNIGVELTESGFEYFAGGDFLESFSGDKEKLYDLAQQAGYKLINTQAEAEGVTAQDGKVILVAEHLADSNTMNYEIDREEGVWSLAEYVKKGIEVLDNEEGFFMMCEGGKIDWACHANDAGTVVHEVLALEEAVQAAIDFATLHPEETLILVTGDHETGGFSIGYAGTEYDTYLTNLVNQKISFTQFDKQYVRKYIEEKVPFETAMADVEELFGLKLDGEFIDKLVLTEYEIDLLEEAYNMEVLKQSSGVSKQEKELLYGDYSPFSVTITHVLNNKSGISFTSYYHTGLPVGIFAEGTGAELFNGYFDNTDIFHNLAALTGVE